MITLFDIHSERVYVIQQGADGPVKIGCTVGAAEYRLNGLQVGNPEELHIRFVMAGGRQLERELHRKFVKLHIRGEWFKAKALEIIHAKYGDRNLMDWIAADRRAAELARRKRQEETIASRNWKWPVGKRIPYNLASIAVPSWLFANQKTVAWLGKEVSRPKRELSSYLDQHVIPSNTTAFKISRALEGAVDTYDWVRLPKYDENGFVKDFPWGPAYPEHIDTA